MRLKFRAVRLEVQTPGGTLGHYTRFADGVIVVRGRNTTGKSLLLQSMLYGLGLDDIFSMRQGVLTRAMSSEIDVGLDRRSVTESFVEVEIENARGDVATVRRSVKSQNPSAHQLVRVWNGPFLTENLSLENRPAENNYFVNRVGGAASEAGFHSWLASFLEWVMPGVPRYDASDTILYVQEPLALSYVDQKHGWGGTVPQVPTRYKIIDPLTQAVAFVLDLDSLRHGRERRELDDRIRQVSLANEKVQARLEAAARLQGGRVVFPAMPKLAARTAEGLVNGAGDEDSPAMQILVNDRWVDLEERIAELSDKRRRRAVGAALTQDRRTDQVSEGDLTDAKAALNDAAARLQAVQQSGAMLRMQSSALHRRLHETQEERRRYGDLKTLQALGAELAEATFLDGDCPTCHQSLDAVEAIEGTALSVDETKVVLDSERLTLLSLIEQVGLALEANEARETALTADTATLRTRVRALQADLVRPGEQPSLAALHEAVADENALADLQRLETSAFDDISQFLSTRAELLAMGLTRLQIGSHGETASDRERLFSWRASIQNLLTEFEFASARPDEVNLDERYRPVVDGYDISFQGSASDGIRLRWAYLLGLLERGVLDGQHAGFLLIDEPGQQGVEKTSLASLYRSVHKVAERTNGQIFMTTSETQATLSSWFGETEWQVVDLGEQFLLQPLE